MVQKMKSLWERKSTDMLLGIIGGMLLFGLTLYARHEDSNQKARDKQEVKIDEVVKQVQNFMFKMDQRDERQDKLLNQIGIQIKMRWSYDIYNEKADSTWAIMWREAQPKRNSRGGTTSEIKDEMYNHFEFVPQDETQIASERIK